MSPLGILLLVWNVGGGALVDAKLFAEAPREQTVAACESYAARTYPPDRYWHACFPARASVPIVAPAEEQRR